MSGEQYCGHVPILQRSMSNSHKNPFAHDGPESSCGKACWLVHGCFDSDTVYCTSIELEQEAESARHEVFKVHCSKSIRSELSTVNPAAT